MSIKQLLTIDDLLAMPEVPGKRFELLDGELIEMPAASVLHGLITLLVARLIDAYVRDRDLGLTFADGTGYVLRRAPDRVRVPDVSFISWDRVPEDGVPDEGFWQFAPDLAVEIVSPGDRADDVHDKVRQYLTAGTALVWVLWPKHRSVTAHTPDGVTRELGPDEELDGGDVLPGFRARVGDLFEVRRKR